MAKLRTVSNVESGVFQPIAEQAREILGGARLHARRDLLGEQLEQKLSHERPPRIEHGRRRLRS